MPLIALEIFLGFGVPVAWATYELISLRREQRRDREKAEASEKASQGAAATTGTAPPTTAATVQRSDAS